MTESITKMLPAGNNLHVCHCPIIDKLTMSESKHTKFVDFVANCKRCNVTLQGATIHWCFYPEWE